MLYFCHKKVFPLNAQIFASCSKLLNLRDDIALG
jgi:hypothetical protein